MTTFEGGCLCGAVRYKAEADASRTSYCHCTMCRQASGAPVVSWLTVPLQNFSFVKGSPKRYDSSDHAYREFCSDCGTPLTFRSKREAAVIDITSATLDHPDLAPPRDHIWTRSRISWFDTSDSLPRHATERNSKA